MNSAAKKVLKQLELASKNNEARCSGSSGHQQSSPPSSHSIETLIEVMRALRDPNGGCPWDLEQDFRSIAPYTIEEAYEVMDAIERNDMDELKKELGDLLLQPIYHAQLASEKGYFDIEDVIASVIEKMVSRHPHVFGEQSAQSAQDVNEIWDQRKASERAQQDQSAMDGVTLGLPALLRAQKLQKKAAKVGFVWPDLGDVLDKLEEEIQEMRAALENKDPENQREELGDILFVLASLARKLDINAEDALRESNSKFERRFRGLESALKKKGVQLDDASLEEMMAGWNAQKKLERS